MRVSHDDTGGWFMVCVYGVLLYVIYFLSFLLLLLLLLIL